jgi:two-component system NarL family sensor kinase
MSLKISLFKPIALLVIFIGLNIPTIFPQSKIDSLKKALNTKSDQVPVLIELCWEYRYHNPDSARIFGYQALKIAQTNKVRNLEAEALHNLAVTYEAQGDYKKSLAYNLDALKLRKQLNESLKTANTLNNIGIAYDELGNFSLALKYYNEAYSIYKSKKDIEGIALVSTNLGILFKAHQDYKNVIKYYQKANSIYRKLNKPRETAFTEANLGSVYYYTKQYDSCIYYSLKAQQTFKALNIQQFLPITYVNAGIGYAALDQNKKALEFLQTSIKLNTAYNNRKELAFAHIHLAKLMFKLKKMDEAKQSARKAIELAEAIGASKEVMDAKETLAIISQEQGHFKEAYNLHLASTKIKDSLFQKDKTALISDYQVRYQTEKKEQQIQSLNQQSTIQQLEIKQRNLWLGISAFIIVAGAFSIYLIYSRRKIREEARLQTEINKQQEETTKAVLSAEENERGRIALELHDGVGQLLSTALMNMNGLANQLQYQSPSEKEKAQNTLELINDSYDEIRSISHQMMPNALIKTGLTSAVRDFVNKIDKDKIKVSLSIVGLNERLDQQVESVLYRVIQETVNNVIKHAQATKLDIQFLKDDDGIAITIEDNGKGFNKDLLNKEAGIGLKNMMSRIAFLKGTIDFDSTIGKGTLVAIHLP